MAEAMVQVQLQAVVGTVRLRKIGPGVGELRIGPDGGGNVIGSGRNRGAGVGRWKRSRIIGWAGSGRTNHWKRLVRVDAEKFVIAVRADIADRESRVGRYLLFNSERPGNQSGRLQIRLHSACDELGSCGNRRIRIDWKF